LIFRSFDFIKLNQGVTHEKTKGLINNQEKDEGRIHLKILLLKDKEKHGRRASKD